MEEIKGIDVHKLAVFMHDTYEKQAKETGWKTQDQCKVDFEDLPEENKRVMLRTAMLVIEWFNINQEMI